MAKFVGDNDSLFAERMIEDGFYPENLPPVFKITNLHEAALGALASGTYVSDKPTEACKLNSSKRGGKRRIFALPNPTFVVDSAIFFLKYKEEIDEHLVSSDSSSYPSFTPDRDKRPITIESFPEFHKRRRKELSESRYVIKTDISRFYHSIYTHSLPWALHGRTVSKKDRKPDSSTVFGNRLDWILRQSQDGQTVGIPVGPDFSRIISEIIGVSIDNKFKKYVGQSAPLLRLVDDIYIGCDNLDDANTYLSGINESIRDFELDINESKTQILNASDDIEPFWPVELRREIERFEDTTGTHKRADFIYFLDEILRITRSFNDDGIIKFALRQFDKKELWKKYWELLEPFLIRVAINYPHSWDYVARVVAWRGRVHGVNVEKWQSVIHRSISQHIKSGNDSEILWALWLLKELSQPLDSSIFENIIKNGNAFSGLLALDVYRTANSSYKMPKQIILDRLGDAPMMGSHWLFAYEADRQFDLRVKTRNLQGNQFFKQMYDDTVSFYDVDAVPFVFKDKDGLEDVRSAIENPVTSYDDIGEEDIGDEDDFDDLA